MSGPSKIKTWEAVCFVTAGLLTLSVIVGIVARVAYSAIEDGQTQMRIRDEIASAFENPACAGLVKMPASELSPEMGSPLSACGWVVFKRRHAHRSGEPADFTAADIRTQPIRLYWEMRHLEGGADVVLLVGSLFAVIYGLGLAIEFVTRRGRGTNSSSSNYVSSSPASRGRRFAGFLIDLTLFFSLLGVLLVVLELPWLWSSGWYGIESRLRWFLWYGLLTPAVESLPVGVALYVTYYFVQEALWDTTLGKRITGTQVVAVDGSRAAWQPILKRSLIRVLPFEPLSFLGSISEGWHDRWSRTRVVRAGKKLSGGGR